MIKTKTLKKHKRTHNHSIKTTGNNMKTLRNNMKTTSLKPSNDK